MLEDTLVFQNPDTFRRSSILFESHLVFLRRAIYERYRTLTSAGQ